MEVVSLKRDGGSSLPSAAPRAAGVELRAPSISDGPSVTSLVADCPPLDPNSAYCNLLQCAHFAATCVVAQRGGRLVGWLSAYRPPSDPAAVFVWQVAVAAEARGEGLGRRLLEALLARPACAGIVRLQTTITPGNEASWALFRRLAGGLGAPMASRAWLVEVTHLPPGHETEHLVTIGPFTPLPSAAGTSSQ